MVTAVRSCVVVVILLALGRCYAGDEPLSKVEIAKIGKAATALVEVKSRFAYGSAFCIHPSGLFITNEHVAGQGNLTIVLNPGLKNEKVCKATLIRADKELDLALVRVDDVKDLPILSLGADDKLAELMEVVAVGFPFGTALAPDRKGYPGVSINSGSITALRHRNDALHQIQLDAQLNPGNSGGPVLDSNGKVIGVVVAGVRGAGVNFAIPVSMVSAFLAPPDVQFQPPQLAAANLHKPMLFEAQVTQLIPDTAAAVTVDLVLKPTRGKAVTHRMEPADGKYRVTTAPMPAPPGPVMLQLVAQFDNGALNASTADRTFKVGSREVKLSEVQKIQFTSNPRVLLQDGKTVEGAVSGLEEVTVRLGGQSVTVNLAKSAEVRFALAAETDVVWCMLVVRLGHKEIVRRGESLPVQGLLFRAAAVVRQPEIKPPTLEGDKVERKLDAPVADVVVGGGGRYLILHLPKLRQLAVFDVNAAKVVGHIPMEEENARFAAGLEDVVIVLPRAGTVERWSLKTLERDVVVTLPIKGVIKAIAMGSASNGPLLVHWAAGGQPLDHAGYAVLNVENMKVAFAELKLPAVAMMGSFSRDLMHLRAAANGKAFGTWNTMGSPNGMGVMTVTADSVINASYTHNSFGHVLPSPDGKSIITAVGIYKPPFTFQTGPVPGAKPMIPACHGDTYLTLPSVGKTGAATINAPGMAEPLATLPDLELTFPKEDFIKDDFTFDKRVHFIPDALLIITIPATNDRLVLRRLDVRDIDLAPRSARAHHNLGIALEGKNQLGQAIAEFRTAIDLDPRCADAHYRLGLLLRARNQRDDAIAAFRKVIDIDPNSATAHDQLGWTLRLQGNLDEAVIACRKAIALQPREANYHNSLGYALRDQGKLHEAVAEFRQAIKLDAKFGPALGNLAEAERMTAMLDKLPALQKGEFKAGTADELSAMAGLCEIKKLYVARARLYADAFATHPVLADDVNTWNRYNAACSAALAAAGHGKDDPPPDGKKKADLRRQAVEWLLADLAAWTKQLDNGTAEVRRTVQDRMRHWQQDSDLDGIRNADALAQLPAEDRDACQKLWTAVAELLKKSGNAK